MIDKSSNIEAFRSLALCLESFMRINHVKLNQNDETEHYPNTHRLYYLGLTVARCGIVILRGFAGRWSPQALEHWHMLMGHINDPFRKLMRWIYRPHVGPMGTKLVGTPYAETSFIRATRNIVSKYLSDFNEEYELLGNLQLSFNDPVCARYNREELEQLVLYLQRQIWTLESMIPPDMHILKNKYISEELGKTDDEALAVISDLNKQDIKSYFVEVMVKDEMMERKKHGQGFSDFKAQLPAVQTKFSSRESVRPVRFPGYGEKADEEEGKLSTPLDRAQMSIQQVSEGQAESRLTEPESARRDENVGQHKPNASKTHGGSKKEEKQPAEIGNKRSALRIIYEPVDKHGRPENSIERVTTWQNLAKICRSDRNWNEARHWGYQMMHASEKIFGPYDPRTIASMLDLSSTINQLSQKPKFVADAELLESQVQERVSKLLQIESPTTLTGMGDLALTYRSYKQWHMAKMIEVYLVKQGQSLIQDDILADLLFNDISLRKTYQIDFKKLGAERFSFHHDVVLAEFIARINLEESANRGIVQAIHLTQDESRRKCVTRRIIHHIQNSTTSKYEEKEAIVQERLLDFRPSLTVLTQTRAFLHLKSSLEDSPSIPWTIREALNHGDIEVLQQMLETRFDVVTQDEYSWLRELVDVGYSYRELAELLLEQASDAPWIFFEPTPFDNRIEISTDAHVQGCVHGFEEIWTSDDASSTSPVIKSSPAIWKEMTRTLEELCGLAGVIPSDRDRSEWTGSVQFAEQNTVATVTCSQLSDAPDLRSGVPIPVYIERIKKSLTNFCLAAAHAQAAGLCCDSFTILRIRSESSLKLEHIKLYPASTMMRHLDDVSGGELETRRIRAIAAMILDPLTENGFRYNNNYNKLDALEMCSLATQVLCLGFLSYIQAHVGPIRPFFLDTSL